MSGDTRLLVFKGYIGVKPFFIKMDNVEVLYFSEEIHEMSEKLGSMVAHLDAKSTGVQPRNIESSETLDELLKTATNVHDAWKEFREKLEFIKTADGDEFKRNLASAFLEFSDDVMGSAPMIKGLSWRIYATDPELPILLSLIVTSHFFAQVLNDMEKSISREYDRFYAKINPYLMAYQLHRQHLQKHDAQTLNRWSTRRDNDLGPFEAILGHVSISLRLGGGVCGLVACVVLWRVWSGMMWCLIGSK